MLYNSIFIGATLGLTENPTVENEIVNSSKPSSCQNIIGVGIKDELPKCCKCNPKRLSQKQLNVPKCENVSTNSEEHGQNLLLRVRPSTGTTKLTPTEIRRRSKRFGRSKPKYNIITHEPECLLLYSNGEIRLNNNAQKPLRGLDKFETMNSMFVQESYGIFNWLPSILRSDFSYDLFHEETSAPIMTIKTQSNYLGKILSGFDNLQFHVYYTKEFLEREPRLCLSIKCSEIVASDCHLHKSIITLANGNLPLGSCDFISFDPRRPVLHCQNFITSDAFIVNSRLYRPGVGDVDFIVHKITEGGDPWDRGQSGPVIGIISRRIPKLLRIATADDPDIVYPENERFTLSFLGYVDPFSKALLFCGTLLIKRDLFGP